MTASMPAGCRRFARRIGRLRSTFVRSAGVDGEGVNALGDQGSQGIINEAMAGHSGEALEADGPQAHRKVPPFARAGVAWAAPAHVPRDLAEVNRALVHALADLGFETDPRPYRPHLTLARRCTRVVEGTIDPPIAWRVDRVVLMSSRLLPEGPRYREVAGWTTG